MAQKTLLDRQADWLATDGPEAATVVLSHAYLFRNLAEFPFPGKCSDSDRKTVEERILAVLDHLSLLENGRYYPLGELDVMEKRFLVERRIITHSMIRAAGPHGVYISDDQGLSIVVNGRDHITLHAMAAGQQLQEAWARLNMTDDTLGSALDFAFDKELGYLTSAVDAVGTGLRAAVLMHLPALAKANRIVELARQAQDRRETILPLYGDLTDATGCLYGTSNTATLGASEEEIVFRLRHSVMELTAQEKQATEEAEDGQRREMADRVGRALGVARGAHLLGFDEAVDVLSSLRMGLAMELAEGFTYQTLNELLFASQPAHIKLRKGKACDELTLSTERATLFRARFS